MLGGVGCTLACSDSMKLSAIPISSMGRSSRSMDPRGGSVESMSASDVPVCDFEASALFSDVSGAASAVAFASAFVSAIFASVVFASAIVEVVNHAGQEMTCVAVLSGSVSVVVELQNSWRACVQCWHYREQCIKSLG